MDTRNLLSKIQIAISVNLKTYVSTPYIRGTSERISKILRKYDIVLSNKPSNTLFNKFNNLKDPFPNNYETNVVYQLSCDNCKKIFISARHANNFQIE